MQVTHQNVKVTHAVLGGGTAMNFGISDSPEFFQILSSTLYSDQKRAVVRETICNAWDAHIASGRTNVPVKITVTPQSMTIQDFGEGISKDMITPIYGVYGSSTKKNDGKQTGGFGLGSKSPFAYGDHFQVTSSHAGVRTIYNMSKSNAEAMGRPSITPIASFPTHESGIIVSINLKSYDDSHIFMNLIKEITYVGEILVELNGKVLPRLPLSTVPHNFIISSESFTSQSGGRIWVRYGNVIYPVVNHKEYERYYNNVDSTIRNFGSGRNHYSPTSYSILFMAPPNSIAVTPSRESLSMQEHTIATLKTILSNFKEFDSKEFVEESNKLLRIHIDLAFKNKEYKEIIVRQPNVPLLEELRAENNTSLIFDIPSGAKHLLNLRYPASPDVWSNDLIYRLHKLREEKFEPRGLVDRLFEVAIQCKISKFLKFRRELNRPNLFFRRNIVTKLYKQTYKHPFVDFNNFRVHDDDYTKSNWGYNNSMHLLKEYGQDSATKNFALLRNYLVITNNREEFHRINKFPCVTELGEGPYIIYFCDNKTKNIEEIRKFFNEETNFRVIDLTMVHPWEPQQVVPLPTHIPPVTTIPPKPRIKGLPLVSAGNSSSGNFNFNNIYDTSPRSENFEYVVRSRLGSNANELGTFGTILSALAAKHFGDVGGVCTNTAQYERYTVNKKIPAIEPYVVNKVIEYIGASPGIIEYLPFNKERIAPDAINDNYEKAQHLRIIYDSAILRAEYGIVDNRTELDKEYMLMWAHINAAYNRITKHWNSISPVSITDADTTLKAIPLDPAVDKLVTLLNNSTLISMVDYGRLRSILRPSTHSPPAVVDAAIEFFKSALKS